MRNDSKKANRIFSPCLDWVGKRAKALNSKILIVLVLLMLFSASAFSAACAGGCREANCSGLGTAACSNYYHLGVIEANAHAAQCYVDGGQCKTNAGCSPKCSLGTTCENGRTATLKCANIKVIAACPGHYQTTGATDKTCFPYGAVCKAGDACIIPEFFGIEFNEMEISTGITALIAAIVLPTILFRKKR